MKFLIIDKVHTIVQEILQEHGHESDYLPEIKPDEVRTAVKHYGGLILRSKIVVDKQFIDANPQLHIIARVGSGMENIDVDYARSKGIICLNSPEGNRDSVAEHAMGMLLALLHNICLGNEQVKDGLWLREENRGYELMGKTVGIIGFGNTGSAFAQRLSSFGVQILAYDKYKHGFGNDYVTEVTLEQIFEHADVVSFHVPLTDETRGMFNKRFIKRFRKNFYLINTSRGQVVNTRDLIWGLERGKIYGAALDVLEWEKHDFQMNAHSEELEYLRRSKKVILTPHIAGLTHQSYYKLSKIIAQKILKALEEKM